MKVTRLCLIASFVLSFGLLAVNGFAEGAATKPITALNEQKTDAKHATKDASQPSAKHAGQSSQATQNTTRSATTSKACS